MVPRILVAYASRKGSTAGIAQAVGKELKKAGITVEIAEMKSVSSLAGYTAVVIGGPLYMGSVDGAVGKFVGQNREQLAKLPVAAFVVGLAPKNPDPGAMEQAKAALKKSLEPLNPLEEIVFAGKLDPAKLSFIQRKMTELVKSPVGDFRDWTAITAWARELPSVLKV
jgi:menaquinone-dependent protoporphyrinogen oxidase